MDMKRRLITIAIVGILLPVLLWLATHSLMEIEVQNPSGNQEIGYTLLEQRSRKTTFIKTTSPKIKKLVRRGSYEISIQQGEQTYISIAKASGFLTKKTVKGKVSPERSRKFIGNNPLPCMHLVSNTLLSMACGDMFGNLKVHVPATGAQPTHTGAPSSNMSGFVEGIVATNEGSVVVIRSAEATPGHTPHAAYLVNGAGQLSPGANLTDLKEDEFYSLARYKEGFLAYDYSGGQIFHYATRQAGPSRLNVAKPSNKGLELYALNVHGDSIILTYSSSKAIESEALNFDDPEGLRAHSESFEEEHHEGPEKSEIVVYKNGHSKHFSFNTVPTMARLCGTDKLCYLHEGRLDIYDISGSKQKHLFMVEQVSAIENFTAGLLVVKEDGLLNLSVDKQEGFLAYSFGDYSYCGIQAHTNDYVLCLNNSKNERIALYINHIEPNKGSIDKKVAELLKMPQVKDLSVYDTFIYISPEIGELAYNEAEGGYVPDAESLAATNQAINQTIDRLGINRSAYTIINAFE